jgi:hypothetical protein
VKQFPPGKKENHREKGGKEIEIDGVITFFD